MRVISPTLLNALQHLRRVKRDRASVFPSEDRGTFTFGPETEAALLHRSKRQTAAVSGEELLRELQRD
jgi:hypothetical protein